MRSRKVRSFTVLKELKDSTTKRPWTGSVTNVSVWSSWTTPRPFVCSGLPTCLLLMMRWNFVSRRTLPGRMHTRTTRRQLQGFGTGSIHVRMIPPSSWRNITSISVMTARLHGIWLPITLWLWITGQKTWCWRLGTLWSGISFLTIWTRCSVCVMIRYWNTNIPLPTKVLTIVSVVMLLPAMIPFYGNWYGLVRTNCVKWRKPCVAIWALNMSCKYLTRNKWATGASGFITRIRNINISFRLPKGWQPAAEPVIIIICMPCREAVMRTVLIPFRTVSPFWIVSMWPVLTVVTASRLISDTSSAAITGKFGLRPPNGIITGTGTRPEHRTKARYLQKRPGLWWNWQWTRI